MNGVTLRTQEYEALAGALDQLYLPVTPEEFPAHLFRVVSALLPDTLTSFDFIDLATGKVESHIPTGAVTTRSPPRAGSHRAAAISGKTRRRPT